MQAKGYRYNTTVDSSGWLVGLVRCPLDKRRLYAMNAIEQTGLPNETVNQATEIAHNRRYEFTVRYGKRLKSKCER